MSATRVSYVWSVCLLVALFAIAQSNPKPPLANGQGAIQGVVTDWTGSPVSGVTVTAAENSGKNSAKVTANACGAFWLALPAGTYTVTVIQPGLKVYRAKSVVVRSLESTDMPIRLKLGAKHENRKASPPSRNASPCTSPKA